MEQDSNQTDNSLLHKILERVEKKLDDIDSKTVEVQIRLTKIEGQTNNIDVLKASVMEHGDRLARLEEKHTNTRESVDTMWGKINTLESNHGNRLTAAETKSTMTAGIIATVVSIVVAGIGWIIKLLSGP